MKFLRAVLTIVFLISGAGTVSAQETGAASSYSGQSMSREPREGFVGANMLDLAQTTISLSVDTIDDDKMIDDFAELVYCPLYKENYQNDFGWQKIRQKIRNEIAYRNIPFHRNYQFVVPVRFQRYNFQGQYFPLEDKSKVRGISMIPIYTFLGDTQAISCVRRGASAYFPLRYQAKLTRNFSMDRIKIAAPDADAYLKRLDARKFERIAFMRVRIRILDKNGYYGEGGLGRVAIFNAQLEGVDFFEDPQLTVLLSKAL